MSQFKQVSEKDQVMGYEANFNPELDKKYQCPICLAALRKPVQTKCGHRFCKTCLNKVTGSKRFIRCPVDNTWFDSSGDVFEDVAVKREVLSLKVNCSGTDSEDNCTWTGELRLLQDHLEACGYVTVPCSNNCGNTCQKRLLSAHMDACPCRLQKCYHCDEEVVFSNMAKHHLFSCMKFPVNCATCGETGLLREEIPLHEDAETGDCPLVIVTCKFSYLGCVFEDRRMKMDAHYALGTDHHMLLLSSKLLLQEDKLARHERELSNTKSLCSVLTENCHKKSREIVELKALVRSQLTRKRETL